jgi:predicted deacylase
MQLAAHHIEGHAPGPHVLITGGVHGDEFEPMAAVRRLIHEVRPQDLRGRLTLIPVVNEPAFRLGRRAGDDGLDLARTCPGRADGSPTEQIAHALATHIRRADAYVDLHTGGTRLRVLPMTGYMLHPDAAVLEKQRRMARAFGLPVIWGTDPNLNGRSLSVARDAGIPSLYAEYLGGGLCDPEGIRAYVDGCWNVLASLGMLDPPASPAPKPAVDPLVVEDDRPESGHMQINHPSPCEGFFAPAVSLGQPVRQGEPFGSVTDPLGSSVAGIPAAKTGIVLVLHSFSRVNAGDSLGVILETGRTESC